MSLWTFAQTVYGREAVEAIFLDLQDSHGQSIPYLLWAAWARCEDDEVLHQAARIARQWDETATEPLRRARRGLKLSDLGPHDERHSLRGAVKAAELESERLLLQALQELTPPAGAASVEASLQLAAEVWGESMPAGILSELSALMAPAFQTRSAPHPALPGEPADDEEDDAETAALREQLSALRQEHQDLDASITALESRPAADQLQIARLKRRKLLLKDQIGKIEDRLTPDIIA